MMKRFILASVVTMLGVFLFVILASGCASLPVKERAVQTLNATQNTLGQIQDTERRLCNAAEYAVSPSTPIKACAGPLADATMLTTERHQRIAAALSKAFDAQIKAAVVLRAWRAGDPVPSTLPDILDALASVAAVVEDEEEFEKLANVLQPGDELVLHGGTYSQNSRCAVASLLGNPARALTMYSRVQRT
jgi:hypothetical protein